MRWLTILEICFEVRVWKGFEEASLAVRLALGFDLGMGRELFRAGKYDGICGWWVRNMDEARSLVPNC